jgi:invasion protein IalB
MKYMILRSFAATTLAVLVSTPATANQTDFSRLSYAPWDKTCLNETCFVWSDGHSSPDCGPVVSATLIEQVGKPKKTLRITLLPRVNMARGVRIIIDDGEAIERPYAGCRANGCTTDYEAGAELITKLKHGRILGLEVVDNANSPISLAIPILGFADAYDGASHQPKVVETTAKELQAEIEKRKVRCEMGQSQ